MHKAILLGAGALALPCAFGMHAGGAAAGMGLCLALLRLTAPCLPYPGAQKSRVHFPRLFFAWAAFCFFLAAGQAVVSAYSAAYLPFPAAMPLLRGALPFPAAALAAEAFAAPLTGRLRAMLGGVFLLLFILLIFCTR